MIAVDFRVPVTIFVGLGFPVDVESVLDAHRVLSEWLGPRDYSHTMAVNACLDALHGDSTVEAAREQFAAFASARGILAAEALRANIVHAAEDGLVLGKDANHIVRETRWPENRRGTI